MRQKHKQ